MTAMDRVQRIAQVKSELSALHRAQVIAEQTICLKCGRYGRVDLIDHAIKVVKSCCEGFKDELTEKVSFGS